LDGVTGHTRLLELENDALSSVYDERVLYNIGIYMQSGLSEHQTMTKGEIPNSNTAYEASKLRLSWSHPNQVEVSISTVLAFKPVFATRND
jgi:predicted Zn-dependent protease with MMP-like domain